MIDRYTHVLMRQANSVKQPSAPGRSARLPPAGKLCADVKEHPTMHHQILEGIFLGEQYPPPWPTLEGTVCMHEEYGGRHSSPCGWYEQGMQAGTNV